MRRAEACAGRAFLKMNTVHVALEVLERQRARFVTAPTQLLRQLEKPPGQRPRGQGTDHAREFIEVGNLSNHVVSTIAYAVDAERPSGELGTFSKGKDIALAAINHERIGLE